MTASRSSFFPCAKRGFTLIELLTVIAVIGILVAITVPIVGRVRDNAKKTKTRVQFSQWGAGIRLFKQAYGYYPRFEVAGGAHKVNGSLAYNGVAVADPNYLFRELLSGKGAKPNGSGFDFASSEQDGSASLQNRKRQQFVSFDISEIVSTTGVDAGDSEMRADGAIKDAFGNVEIAVLVDRNNDGFINITDLASGVAAYPAVTAKGNLGTVSSATVTTRINAADASGKGVRADVIFYSPGIGARNVGVGIADNDAVWSW
jgi:prepilin-type N-terminal cleavage/methylation domain-containing protein